MPDGKEYEIPRIVMPLADIPAAGESPPPSPVSPGDEPQVHGDPEDSGNLPYVMRSKKYGSTDPDDDTVALGTDEANPDTWERDDPPYRKTVAVSGVTPNGVTTITTAGHDVPSSIVGTFTVLLAGLVTSPDINGLHQATRTSATEFTIAISADSVTSGVGTAAILTSGVTLDAEPRMQQYGSNGWYMFTRQKKWDRFGNLYYISGETKYTVT
jgi:hypothetical protein